MSFLTKYSVQKRIVVGLAALTITVGLAGCSNDAEANSEDSTDTTDVETEYIPASADGPAQNVPEPNLPAVATENTEEGAEATLQYFWEAIDYARETGETGPVELVSLSDCDFCSSFMSEWADAYDNEQWALVHGDAEYQVSESWIGFDENQDAPNADLLFSLSDPAVDLYNSDGDVEQSSEASETATDWFVIMVYDATAQRWQVEWIGVEELVEWEDQ